MKAVEERLTITFPKLADKTLWYPLGDVLTEPGLFLVFGHEQVYPYIESLTEQNKESPKFSRAGAGRDHYPNVITARNLRPKVFVTPI